MLAAAAIGSGWSRLYGADHGARLFLDANLKGDTTVAATAAASPPGDVPFRLEHSRQDQPGAGLEE